MGGFSAADFLEKLFTFFRIKLKYIESLKKIFYHGQYDLWDRGFQLEFLKVKHNN